MRRLPPRPVSDFNTMRDLYNPPQASPLRRWFGRIPFLKRCLREDIVTVMSRLVGLQEEIRRSHVVRFTAMVDSMTPGERRDPEGISYERCMRISRGSGLSPQYVQDLVHAMRGIRDWQRRQIDESRPEEEQDP